MHLCPAIILVLFQLGQVEPDGYSLAVIKETYARLRNMNLDAKGVIEVDSLILKKDCGEFVFLSGRLYCFEPIRERVVAAYFEGSGIFRLTTDDRIERQQIQRFTGADAVEKTFSRILLLFTDSTCEAIGASRVTKESIPTEVFKRISDFRRSLREMFIWNFDARILSDLVAVPYGNLFMAFIESSDDHFLFIIDHLDEEPVSLLRYHEIKFLKRVDYETWFSSMTRNVKIQPGPGFDITAMDIDAAIDAGQNLRATVQMHFRSLEPDVRLVPITLVPQLRVESVLIDNRDTCFFIQEDEELDGELWVAFPRALPKDKTNDLIMTYSGDEVVDDIGGDNFVVRARGAWYPSFNRNPYDPRRFKIRFSVPKGMTLLSTGRLVGSGIDGDAVYSEWDTDIAYTVAGFNYGKFSKVEKRGSSGVIECYTNTKLSDDLAAIRRILEEYKELQAELMMFPQELTTDRIGDNAAIECQNAYEVFTHFFGKIPIRTILVSQQPQVSFGQSWPALIYLPFTAFWDESVKERLGILRGEKSVMWYETLASHEIAHQWWGHTIATVSYHDEWLEEGFATYASALYLQASEGTDRFKEYMKMLQDQVWAKVENGKPATELGPVWLGDRLRSFATPSGKRLIYAKGAYILHMLRMLLFDYTKKSDDRFIAMMQDFTKTYAGKVITTKDFKKVVERHFGQDMDWFFDQWVYGTEVPVYRFEYEVSCEGRDKYLFSLAIEQSNVSVSFKMPMHLLINFEDGYSAVEVICQGPGTTTKNFTLPQKPVSITFNPWHGVLCRIVR